MQFKVYCKNINDILIQKNGNTNHIYYGSSDSYTELMPEFYNILSDFEKERVDRFKNKPIIECYITAHALLRLKLSEYLNTDPRSVKIEIAEGGKPFVAGVDLPFSISRNKNLFTFVIGESSQLLGIDIEKIVPDFDIRNISRNYFSIKEHKFIFAFGSKNDQERSFFEIWTRKEALLKAIGIGMITDLSKVQVLEGENLIDIDELLSDPGSFHVATIMINGTLISIASSSDLLPGIKVSALAGSIPDIYSFN